MASEVEAVRWCPNCRAEYRPFVGECSDCLIPLVDVLPEPEVDRRDHGVSEWELTEWDERQLRSLFRLLDGATVAYEWEAGPNTLRVGSQDAATVDGLLELFDDDFTLVETEADTALALDAPIPYVFESEIAGLGRRASGFVIDGIVNGVVAAPVWFALNGFKFEYHRGTTFFAKSVVISLLVVAYEAVAVARWGKTVGKLLLETRVVSEKTEDLPSLGQAFRRAVLLAFPGFLGLIGSVVALAILGAAAFDDKRRGLHDRFAGTIVLYEKRASRTRRNVT